MNPVQKKSRRRGLILIVGLSIILTGGYLGLSAYMAATLSQTEREAIVTSPKDYHLNFESATFPSAEDHLQLKGWFIPAPSKRMLIFVHGKGHHRDASDIQSLSLAARLNKMGFNILMFDLRGYGESQGERFSLGFYEPRDVRGAVDYAMARGFAPDDIGVIGWSMGAATALISTARDTRIAAVVADSGYADLAELLSAEVPKRSGLPPIFTPGILLMAKAMYGIDVSDIRPIDAIKRIAPRHILIIHTAQDPLIPVKNAFRLYAALPDKMKNYLWVVPGTAHVSAYKDYQVEYARRIDQFFSTELK